MNDVNSLSHTSWNCKYYMISSYKENTLSKGYIAGVSPLPELITKKLSI